MERWRDKVAVVTGASAGIGAACVKNLVASGMIVVGLARRLDRMENELKSNLVSDKQNNFHALKCDVAKEDDIVRCFAWVEQHLGGVDVLVNNAGTLQNKFLTEDNNTAALRATLDTNVMGVALCTREAFRSMKKRKVDGHIVIINSVAGHKVPIVMNRTLNMYAPSKHAITAMTEILRQEFMLNETLIKVTSISPGVVDTDILSAMEEMRYNPNKLHAEDIADAVKYCIQTPANVQIHEMIIKPIGEVF